MNAEQIPDRLPPDFFETPFTGRALKDFAECRRKFLLSRFVPRQETRRFLGGGAILHQGLRGAIAEAYQQGADSIVELFDEYFEGHLCADSLTEENLRRQGRAIVSDFATDWMADHPEALHVDLTLTEEMYDARFRAVADLVFEGDDTDILVVRLNSSRRPPSENELSEDITALLLLLLSRRHFEPESASVAYYCLRAGRLQTVEADGETVEYLKRDLESRVQRIKRERRFEARPGKHCRWCRARGVCEAWKR
ncbi:MAG: PD-(D/E)XK nuclease family protein [Armatimonadota bacterium]